MDLAKKKLLENLKNNDIVVIGESGGPDSMCLLYLVNSLKNKLNLTIIAAHVNHNVRSVSDEESSFIQNYCKENDIIFESMKIEKYSDDNFHNQARKIRYDFFETIVSRYKANYLMTAHHADDLMETILMRIVRGSSLKGYCGFESIIKKQKYILLRPLIDYTKKEIEDFDKENEIPYVIDHSNEKDVYTRNRFRMNVLPFLKKEDKNVHKKFIEFSNKLIECNNFINEYVIDKIKYIFNNNELNITEFNKCNPFIKNKIIENILYRIYSDDLFVINDNHVNLINKIINSKKKNIIINMPHNIIVKKEYDKLLFCTEKNEINNFNIELQNEIILNNGMEIKIIENSDDTSNYCTRLLLDEVELPLYIRNRQDGDKIEIKKLNGSKKVKDVFIDSKISMKDRNDWPILVDSLGNVLWIPGLKKSKFDKDIKEKYDILIKYE